MTLRKLLEQIIRENTFNGYKNRDTYNAILYLENDHAIYRIYSPKIGTITAIDAKKFFGMLRSKNPVGYNDVNQKLVDWQEVADSLNDQG